MAKKTNKNPCLPCVALALNPQERRVAGYNPTATRGQYLVMGEDAYWKDWDKLASHASGKLFRLVKGKPAALAAAKSFMAKNSPHKDYKTPIGFNLTAFVSIRDYQGKKLGFWVGKDGKWVDEKEAKENPCKARSRQATRKRRPRLSAARRHAILNPGPRKKYIGVVGDAQPIERGGGIVYDAGYGPTLTYFEPFDSMVQIFTIPIKDDVFAVLSWVDWDQLASYEGRTASDMGKSGKSSDVLERARLYEMAGVYEGFLDLDSGPETMSLAAAERRWGRSVDAAQRAGQKRTKGNPMASGRKRGGKAKAALSRPGPKAKRPSPRAGQSRPWITKDGKLIGASFLTKSATLRHRMLAGCVKKYSYRSCVGALQTLYRDAGTSVAQGRKLDQDRKHLVETYGGTKSWSSHVPKTSNAMVAQVARDLDNRAKRSGVAPKKKAAKRPVAKKRAKRVTSKRRVPRRNPGMTAGQIIGAVTR